MFILFCRSTAPTSSSTTYRNSISMAKWSNWTFARNSLHRLSIRWNAVIIGQYAFLIVRWCIVIINSITTSTHRPGKWIKLIFLNFRFSHVARGWSTSRNCWLMILMMVITRRHISNETSSNQWSRPSLNWQCSILTISTIFKWILSDNWSCRRVTSVCCANSCAIIIASTSNRAIFIYNSGEKWAHTSGSTLHRALLLIVQRWLGSFWDIIVDLVFFKLVVFSFGSMRASSCRKICYVIIIIFVAVSVVFMSSKLCRGR